jgi:predicted dehydrogenase
MQAGRFLPGRHGLSAPSLDDKELDAVFIATPNFWHTPAATALRCRQGKHVYVEKPGSQNPHEAEMIVATAEKHGRLVQMGNQRRTWMKPAIEAHCMAVPSGTVNVLAARFYYNTRKAVGEGALKAADPEINMDLWQGPVPDEAGRDIKPFVHYDWHWLWHWGNGELGNNGIHSLDILRWGLKVDYPERITYNGGRYLVQRRSTRNARHRRLPCYDCGEGRLLAGNAAAATHALRKSRWAEVHVLRGQRHHGHRCAIQLHDSTILKAKSSVSDGKGPPAAVIPAHMGNFIDAIRGDAKLNSPIDRRSKEHHALPPRESRLSHWLHDPLRPGDRKGEGQSCRREALVPDVPHWLGA